MTKQQWPLIVALALALSISAGCSQKTINSASQDASNDAQSVDKSVDQAAQQVKPAMASLGLGARVEAALAANANLPKTIRVDASPNGVRLKGSVKTVAEKKLAVQVTKETVGPGKSVTDEIAVAP